MCFLNIWKGRETNAAFPRLTTIGSIQDYSRLGDRERQAKAPSDPPTQTPQCTDQARSKSPPGAGPICSRQLKCGKNKAGTGTGNLKAQQQVNQEETSCTDAPFFKKRNSSPACSGHLPRSGKGYVLVQPPGRSRNQ